MRVNPLALLMLLPLVEIASCILVGQAIGLGPTLLLLILDAVLGMALIRAQGRGALADLTRFAERRTLPDASIADRFCLAIAGALLMIPGFASDIVAIALLLPPVRARILRRTRPGGSVSGSGGISAGATVIDADYTIVEEAPEKPARIDRPDGQSPWGKGGQR